jgi:hypothetical protein
MYLATYKQSWKLLIQHKIGFLLLFVSLLALLFAYFFISAPILIHIEVINNQIATHSSTLWQAYSQTYQSESFVSVLLSDAYIRSILLSLIGYISLLFLLFSACVFLFFYYYFIILKHSFTFKVATKLIVFWLIFFIIGRIILLVIDYFLLSNIVYGLFHILFFSALFVSFIQRRIRIKLHYTQFLVIIPAIILFLPLGVSNILMMPFYAIHLYVGYVASAICMYLILIWTLTHLYKVSYINTN